MSSFFGLVIFFFALINFAFGELGQSFSYDDKGKRDPFFPLVDENGQYLLESGLFYSPDELKLSGILWDPQGRSSALINNQIVKIGESCFGFVVKDITKNSVIITQDKRDYTIGLSMQTEGVIK